jgi:hypothetical protein
MAKNNKISLRAGKSAPMTGVGRAAIQANRSSQPLKPTARGAAYLANFAGPFLKCGRPHAMIDVR